MRILSRGRLSSTFLPRVAFATLCFAALSLPLRADPVPSLDQITVVDQGSRISVLWHFYYRLLPSEINLPGLRTQVSLGNPATLKDNLSTLAAHAFEMVVDGQAQAPLSVELNLAPDGGAFANLVYPGRKQGRLRLRETLLPLYPPTYIINYDISSPLARERALTGYFTGGPNPPVVEYTQIGDDYRPSVFDVLEAQPVKLFKVELRAAWINPAWLFLTIIVILIRPAGELYPLAWMMAMAWMAPIYVWAKSGVQVPFALHPVVPALVTAAIGVLLLRGRPAFPRAAVVLVVAGILHGCVEIQQTALERPPPTGANLAGLCLGLVAGFALVFAVTVPITLECRKFPGFTQTWAPRICGALAVAALVLSA